MPRTSQTTRVGRSVMLATLLGLAAQAASGATRDVAAAHPGISSTAGRVVRADLDELTSRRTLFLLGSGAALSAASLTFENADREAVGLEHPAWDGVSDFGNEWGSGVTLGAAALTLAAVGHVAGRPNLSGAGLDMSRALVYSGVLVYGLKYAVNRQRPNGQPYSFPSGHSAAAFAVAPVIGSRFGRAAGIVAYGLAAATGLGRMEDRKHYLSDVAFGAAIGTACGLAVTRSSTRLGAPSLAIAPRGVALGLAF